MSQPTDTEEVPAKINLRRIKLAKPIGRIWSIYERVLHRPPTLLIGSGMAGTNSVFEIIPAKYVLVMTERPEGARIATPMWFAVVNETIYLRTAAASGKVRRIREEPLVYVAACNFRGRLKSGFIRCEARIMLEALAPKAESALQRRYGLGRRLLTRFTRTEQLYIELNSHDMDGFFGPRLTAPRKPRNNPKALYRSPNHRQVR